MRRRRSVILAGALLVVPMVFGTTTASAVTPGNNGTVKMDGLPLDNPDSPDNEPHIGCYFQVDFYGYDEGDLDATASLVLHPPTGGTGLALVKSTDIGEDPAGGGTDLDASILFTTDDLRPWIVANGSPTPHEIQGFHVKLTVNAEGSQGSDVKHKVFWIKCHDGALPGM